MHVLFNEDRNIAPFGVPSLTQVKVKKRVFNDEKNRRGGKVPVRQKIRGHLRKLAFFFFKIRCAIC